MDNLTSIRKPKKQKVQSPDFEIDFLSDSRAETNINKIPNEIRFLHPKLSPSKTSSKLATAEGTSPTN